MDEVGGGLQPGKGVFGGEIMAVAQGVGAVDGFERGHERGRVGQTRVGAEMVFVEIGQAIAVGGGREPAGRGVDQFGDGEIEGLPCG